MRRQMIVRMNNTLENDKEFVEGLEKIPGEKLYDDVC